MLARTRLYADPDGRLHSLIGAASGDLSFALSELTTRNDYALQVSDAEVHVELIPEPGFAQVVEIEADTVAGLGSALPITASLRVGRRADRDIGLELALPDTIPAGIYQLEVGSAASLGDPGGDFGFFGGLTGIENMGLEGGEGQTLEEVFARLNAPDENTVLKARLTFFEPLWGPVRESSEPPGSGADPGSDFGPGDSLGDFLSDGQAATVSTEQEVGLVIGGTQALQITVGREDAVPEGE